MEEKAIYQKTEKGREEIATRAYRLKARERSLLFFVDGVSSGAVLMGKATQMGASLELFEHLLSEGFIEVIGATPTSTSVPNQSAPAATASPATTSPAALADIAPSQLKEIATVASHFLIDALGPDADNLAMRLEACRSLGELLPQLEKTREVLQSVRGRRKAEEFWGAISPKLPDGALSS